MFAPGPLSKKYKANFNSYPGCSKLKLIKLDVTFDLRLFFLSGTAVAVSCCISKYYPSVFRSLRSGKSTAVKH